MPPPCKFAFYSEARLPTKSGGVRVRLYRASDGTEPLAILGPSPIPTENTPVRIHSACFTSESLGSLKCDCREQLNFALDFVAKHGGVVVYLQQEGRGIGLGDKLRAYALQDAGCDTVQANRHLGLPVDARKYETASLILRDLGIRSVRLMTNNPDKIASLRKLGIHVAQRIPIVIAPTEHSEQYLAAKYRTMGHFSHENIHLDLPADLTGPATTVEPADIAPGGPDRSSELPLTNNASAAAILRSMNQ